MKTCLIVAMTLAVGLLLGPVCHGQGKEPVTKTRPLVVLDGDDSHVTKGALICVSSEKEWDETWLEHIGKAPADRTFRGRLEVDFSRLMVVAVFLGDSINSRGIEVSEILDSPGTMTIRITRRSYQSMAGDEPDPPKRPYAFIVLPKSGKEIVLEENRQRYLGYPPEWKVHARLPSAANRGAE